MHPNINAVVFVMLVEIHIVIAASGYLKVKEKTKEKCGRSLSSLHRLITSEHVEVKIAHVHANTTVGVHSR